MYSTFDEFYNSRFPLSLLLLSLFSPSPSLCAIVLPTLHFRSKERYTLAYVWGLTSRRKSGHTFFTTNELFCRLSPRASYMYPSVLGVVVYGVTLIFDIDLKEFATESRREPGIAGCFCFESNSTIVIIHPYEFSS